MAQAESQVAAGTSHAFTGFVAANRRLGEVLGDIEKVWGRTRAWPVPGGVDAWQRQAGAAGSGRHGGTWPPARGDGVTQAPRRHR